MAAQHKPLFVSFFGLPNDVLLNIARTLDANSLLSDDERKKLTTKPIDDLSIWMELVKRDYGKDVVEKFGPHHNWEKYYKDNFDKLSEFQNLITQFPDKTKFTSHMQMELDELLTFAAIRGHDKWLKEAIKSKVSLSNIHSHTSLLQLATTHRNIHSVSLFLKNGNAKSLIMQKSSFDTNALIAAAEISSDDPTFLKLFLKKCDKGIINEKLFSDGQTLLHRAAVYGNPNCLAFLISEGADISSTATIKEKQMTALAIVEDNKSPKKEECLKVLTEAQPKKRPGPGA